MMMRRALPLVTLLAGFVLLVPGSCADDSAKPAAPTDVFVRAYGDSFYEFDACGDAVSGRTWRAALVEKFRHCPFSAEARAQFQRRSAAQRVKSGEAIAHMIEVHGGLPIRLEGMSQTCREQFDSKEYSEVRRKLDDYAAGRATAETVITGACDTTSITP